MDKVRKKYEFILGFATLVVSLSAFKDELSKIIVNLGYLSFTAAEFFLFCIIGFSISLYLFILEFITRDTALGKLKIAHFITRTAYTIFTIIILSPITIAINWAFYKLYLLIPKFKPSPDFQIWLLISSAMIMITGMIGFIAIIQNVNKQLLAKFDEETNT